MAANGLSTWCVEFFFFSILSFSPRGFCYLSIYFLINFIRFHSVQLGFPPISFIYFKVFLISGEKLRSVRLSLGKFFKVRDMLRSIHS